MTELIHELEALFRDSREYLVQFVHAHGTWVYVLLFAIIFAETGLVITPFLPGDSLLFAAGVVAGLTETPDEVAAGTTGINVHLLVVILIVAAVLGDTVNYHIGKWIGPRAFTDRVRFLKKKHLERTHAFFEKHGGKAIILARFVPIVRTFAPFVAGIGAMTYRKFIAYNVIGAIVWVGLIVYAGYLFAEVPLVKNNFTLVTLGIVIVSVLPLAFEFWRAWREKRRDRRRVPAKSNV